MSKLGRGGLLGNSEALNLKRDDDQQHPSHTLTRVSSSALGSVAPNALATTGSGGLVGKPAVPREPGSFTRSGPFKPQVL